MIISKKTVKVYPNEKLWVSKCLKKTNEKKIAFQSKDPSERKHVQSKLRKEIREAKKQYKEDREFQFQTGSIRDTCKGLKTLAGQFKLK